MYKFFNKINYHKPLSLHSIVKISDMVLIFFVRGKGNLILTWESSRSHWKTKFLSWWWVSYSIFLTWAFMSTSPLGIWWVFFLVLCSLLLLYQHERAKYVRGLLCISHFSICLFSSEIVRWVREHHRPTAHPWQAAAVRNF